MKRISISLAAGLLVAGLIAALSSWAQVSEAELSQPAKAPKLTLQSVEAQVTTLQGQVSALQAAVTALQPNFAVIAANGTLARGSKSVVKSDRLDIGQYDIIFNRDVTDCEINATLGSFQVGPIFLGFIGVASEFKNPDGVFVLITDEKGAFLDAPFHVSVICP